MLSGILYLLSCVCSGLLCLFGFEVEISKFEGVEQNAMKTRIMA
jgi:hypothetical protein